MSDQDAVDLQKELSDFFNNKMHSIYFSEGMSIDGILQNIVEEANSNPGVYEPSISLTTAAGVVSGTLISMKSFFKESAEEMYLPDQGAEVDKAKQNWISMADEKPGAESLPPQFIHLRDARVFTGNGKIPSNCGVLWRGRLNAVIGFAYSGLVP